MEPGVALIGFGEAGQAFALAGAWGDRARAYDKLTDSPETRAGKISDYQCMGITPALSMQEAVEAARVVLSLVTAQESLKAAHQAAPHLLPGALFCDMNSVSPQTKRRSAALVEGAGAHYLDVAIMAPVQPALLEVPLLISGSRAGEAETALSQLGFAKRRVVGARIGHASAIKMIRSVIVKGLEALTAEAMLAAEAAGVTEEVLASLDSSEPGRPWAELADYNLGRMIRHGARRAEEMVEAARTLERLGVAPLCTRATVEWQRQVGSTSVAEPAQGIGAKLEQIRGRKADAA